MAIDYKKLTFARHCRWIVAGIDFGIKHSAMAVYDPRLERIYFYRADLPGDADSHDKLLNLMTEKIEMWLEQSQAEYVVLEDVNFLVKNPNPFTAPTIKLQDRIKLWCNRYKVKIISAPPSATKSCSAHFRWAYRRGLLGPYLDEGWLPFPRDNNHCWDALSLLMRAIPSLLDRSAPGDKPHYFIGRPPKNES